MADPQSQPSDTEEELEEAESWQASQKAVRRLAHVARNAPPWFASDDTDTAAWMQWVQRLAQHTVDAKGKALTHEQTKQHQLDMQRLGGLDTTARKEEDKERSKGWHEWAMEAFWVVAPRTPTPTRRNQ